MEATALWHISPSSSELRKEFLAEVSKNFCEVKNLFSLISLGTERLVASGKVDAKAAARMAVPHMAGDFDLPIKYGYSLVGQVQTKHHPLAGKLVHLLHPHQDNCVVSEKNLFPIPEGIPPARAALASNMETAVNAIWDSGIGLGDRVLVIGFGLIGALIARLAARFPGVEVVIAEKNPQRIKLAQKLGFSILEPESACDFDIAFHCSGSGGGLQMAIESVRKEGRVVELSWYGSSPVSLNLGESFHWDRKQIISSQVSSIPSSKSDRWDFRSRKALVYNLLKDPLFDQLVTRFVPFQQAPAFFDELRAGEVDGVGVCIDFSK